MRKQSATKKAELSAEDRRKLIAAIVVAVLLVLALVLPLASSVGKPAPEPAPEPVEEGAPSWEQLSGLGEE